MTLNETVSVIRDVARLNLRLLKVNELRATLLCQNNELDAARNTVKSLVESAEHTMAIANFKKSQLVEADPEFAKKTAEFDGGVKRGTEHVEAIKADLVREEKMLNEAISRTMEAISAVEDGTTKVSRDDLQTESDRLLKALGKQNAEDAMKKAMDAEF